MATNIYTSVIAKIKTILESVDHIKEVHAHPIGKGARFKNYPAVVFVPSRLNVEFSDSGSNHHTMRFRMWILVQANNIANSTIFETVLPTAADAVVSAIGTGWDFGTIDGHRTWARVETGDMGYTQDENGMEAWMELDLIIRLDTDI